MKQRIEKLQKKLREQKIDALFVTDSYNIRYLTGFVGAESRDAYMIATPRSIFFLTNALYLNQVRQLISAQMTNDKLQMSNQIQIVEISKENPLSKQLKKLSVKENCKNFGFEENNLTVAELKNLNNKTKPLVWKPTANLVEDLRMIKDEEEITALRSAAKLTDDAFSFALSYLRNLGDLGDLTESQLAWEIEKFIREHGGELAFSPIVAFGENSANPHHTSSKLKVQSSKLILLDFGARIDGYCADMSRMIFVGKPTEKQTKIYRTVLAAQEKALDLLKSGERSGAQLDNAARTVLEKASLSPYPHSLGHGVGLQIHEGFRLSHKKDFILKPNMVFTIEPGYYEPDWGGIRIEDLVLLTKDGIELLSQSTKEIICLP